MSASDDDSRPKSRVPAVTAVLSAAMFIVSVPVLFLRASEKRAADKPAALFEVNEEMLAGQRVYQRVCVGCHEPRGNGRPGKYPSLVGSPWLVEDPETPIRIVLLGLKGPIESGGQRFDSVMPNFGVLLTDEEIARVLTFTRATWGNKASAITADQVRKVRLSLGERTEPWAGGAALIEAKKATPPR